MFRPRCALVLILSLPWSVASAAPANVGEADYPAASSLSSRRQSRPTENASSCWLREFFGTMIRARRISWGSISRPEQCKRSCRIAKGISDPAFLTGRHSARLSCQGPQRQGSAHANLRHAGRRRRGASGNARRRRCRRIFLATRRSRARVCGGGAATCAHRSRPFPGQLHFYHRADHGARLSSDRCISLRFRSMTERRRN